MTDRDAGATPEAPLKTLLVVEDEILIRFQICDYLRDCGFKVIEAANADEALLVLKSPDFAVDLVLGDVEMPGSMDGFGLSQWMRREKPGLPIVLVGSPAKAADTAADLCDEGPMFAKPYDPQILTDRIRRLLAEGAQSAADASE